MIPIDLKNCDFFILDRTGANFLRIRIGEGTLSYSVKRDIQPRKSRGDLFQLREGEENPVDVQFQFVWDFITGSGTEPPGLEEVLDGNVSGWESAGAVEDPNGPFTVNLQLVHRVPCFDAAGGVRIETHNFPVFAYTNLDHAIKDSTVDCKGISNRYRPVILRSSA